MSLSSKTELARALFRSTPPESVTRISGTATADSADGTVTVQLEDGDVIEVGTIGSVSSGDTVTIHVQRGEAQVIAAEGWGDAMQTAVDEAQAIAEATGQHFWHDSNGAHVTEVTADQWAQSQTGHNILVNSLGILLRKALNYIAAWTGSALSFYDGNGNATANVTASFGSAGVQVGKVDESHIEMDYHSLQLIDNEGDPYLYVSDLRDNTGVASVVSRFTGDGSTTSFRLPMIATDTDYTVTVTPASGGTVTKTTTEVRFSTAPSNGCLIEVSYDTRANYAKAFTYGSREGGTDIGAMSFSAGYLSSASGFSSTAFGVNSKATGTGSFAIGESHAEGDGSFCGGGVYETENLASGRVSFAYGMSVQALGDHQTVFGKINEPDPNNEYAFIIGNGTTSWGIEVPSNALTVDWSGNVEAAGGLTLGTIDFIECGLTANTAAGTTATWTYVDVKLNSVVRSYGSGLSLATSGTDRYGVVVSKDGYYRISGYANVNAPSYLAVTVDGTTVSNIVFIQSGYNGAGLGSTVVKLTSGSVIKMRIERTGATDPTVGGTTLTRLSVERVG